MSESSRAKFAIFAFLYLLNFLEIILEKTISINDAIKNIITCSHTCILNKDITNDANAGGINRTGKKANVWIFNIKANTIMPSHIYGIISLKLNRLLLFIVIIAV